MAKLKKVVEKDGRCEFAVAQIPTGNHRTSESLWPKSVACLGDIVVNEGTMREKSGCAAFYLDTYTLRTSGVGTEGRMKIANGKKCASDGLEEVTGLNLQGYVDEKAGSFNGVPNLDVGWVFYDGSRTNFMTPTIVYSKSSQRYEAWWNQKRKEVIAQNKALAEKRKVEERQAHDSDLAEQRKLNEEKIQQRKKNKEAEALWKE
ncbi:MAG: hypothetical protein AB7N80_01130 [Bdellovibrionales bacterium]